MPDYKRYGQEALHIIVQDEPSFSFQQPTIFGQQTEHTITIMYAKPIQHYGLLKYLNARRNFNNNSINILAKEVHYLFKGKEILLP